MQKLTFGNVRNCNNSANVKFYKFTSNVEAVLMLYVKFKIPFKIIA